MSLNDKLREAQNDVTALIELMCSASEMSPTEAIDNTVGIMMHLYYVYLGEYHVRPSDMDDLVDGVLYVEAKGYIQNIEMKKQKRGR